jgi:tRNA threonylcarbamoyl adenosine modification protein YjeE
MITLASEEDTIAAAQKAANTVQAGDVIALHGAMGAGKTTFARAFIRQCLADAALPVPSPTYGLLEVYSCERLNDIWHYDAYRLTSPQDILNTGYDDGLAQNCVMLIEWPDNIAGLLPRHTKHFYLNVLADGSRTLDGI